MKKFLQLFALLIPAFALGQTAVQKVGGGNNALSNGSIIVPSGVSITATGTGVIAATSIPSLSINTTAPLTGGGALTGSLTLAIPVATGSVNGYLSSADWTTFNAKQPAGSYITALTGDVTAAGPGSAVATLASVISASSVGSSTAIPVLTYDAKGRLTSTTTAVVIAPAGTLTGATLAANILASSLTSVGTLTGGATGAGFTMALGSSTITGTLGVTNGGNGLNTAALGDLRYGSAANTLAALAGNTSATMAVLTQTGNGTISAAPTWTSTTGTGNVVRAMSPTFTASATFSGLNTANGLVQTNGSGVLSTTLTPSGLTSIGANGISSAALANLTLGTGTFGTALTFTSATGAATFATPVTIGTTNQTLSLLGTNAVTAKIGITGATGAVQIRFEQNNGTFAGAVGYDSSNTKVYLNMFGDATKGLVVDNSHNVSVLGGNFTASGSILGSGVSAPTNTTSGSNQFTAGIATSGPIYAGGAITSIGATLTSAGAGPLVLVGAGNPNATIRGTLSSDISGYSVLNESGVQKAEFGYGGTTAASPFANVAFVYTPGQNFVFALGGANVGSVTTAGNAAFSGNLTISGTATSTFAGSITLTQTSGNPFINIANGSGGSFPLYQLTDNRTNGHQWNIENGRTLGSLTLNDSNGAGVVATIGGTIGAGSVNFAYTTPGTSTTAAAVVGKSSGWSENVYVGGIVNVVGSSVQPFQADSTGTSAAIRLTHSGGTAQSWLIQSDSSVGGLAFYSLTAGAYRASFNASGDFLINSATTATSSVGAISTNGGILTGKNIVVNSTTEATTGGAGSLTTAGGFYAAKKLITASTLTTAAGVTYDFGADVTGVTTTFVTTEYLTVVVNGSTKKIALVTSVP